MIAPRYTTSRRRPAVTIVTGLCLTLGAASITIPEGEALAGRDPYRTLEQLNARLRTLARRHGRRARVVEVAKSVEGREVLALEVSLDGRFRRRAPVLLVHGGIHGIEWLSTEVVLHLAELVLATRAERYRGLRFHFVPALNADGFVKGKRKAIGRDGKPYDPNRGFPVPFAAKPPPGTHRSQPLVEAFRRYAGRGRLAGVLDYHTPAECLLYPWAFSPDRQPPDVARLARVVERMARSVGYCFGQTARVISYRHQGTAQDYLAYTFGVPAVLMELGYGEGPEADYAPQQLIEQERPFRIFVRWLKARLERQRVGSPGRSSSGSSTAGASRPRPRGGR